MKADVLLGLQWGDEGKGKIVDVFTPKYDIIARFQGGPNAGHTLEFNNKKFVLHTVPSGIFHVNKYNIIGNGVVIDPYIFAKEIEHILNENPAVKEFLLISKKGHLILPSHRLMDATLEMIKGSNKIGSTLKGIGPTYTDKVSRCGIRIGDIKSNDFLTKYNNLKNQHLAIINFHKFDIENYKLDGLSFNEYEYKWFEAIKLLSEFKLIDSEITVNNYLSAGRSILAEGAQGTLLDVDFGSYPYVTSSNTVCAGACTGLGIAPNKIGEVFGIFKAYCTRVGSGPFPTELLDETGNKLRKQGNEFGSTTGRPRRCGWLDLPALKYSIKINGATQLIMTKADVMSNFDIIKVCTHYIHDGKQLDYIPFEATDNNLQPVYKELKGWNSDLTTIRSLDQLPKELITYIEFIESELKIPITLISVGPDREQILFR